MLKVEKEYKELYGDIPDDRMAIMDIMLQGVNLKRQKKHVYDEINRITNIGWKTISFKIFLVPKATPRPRSGKNGVFYVKGASDNRKVFRKFMEDQEFDIIKTPTKFDCTCYFPIPSSMTIVERICAEMGFIRPISKPDWDNVAKTYCDMCQDFLIYDDSLIVDGRCRKYYSLKPRIEITMSYMESYDSDYNRKKTEKK